jgi:hypothetical protein
MYRYHLGLPAESALSLPNAISRERFSVKQQANLVFHSVHLIACDRPNSKIKMGPVKLSSRFESTTSSIRDPYVPQDQLRDHQLFGHSGNDFARLNMTFMGPPPTRHVPHQSLPIEAPKDLVLLECSSSLSNNKDSYYVPAKQQRDEDTTFSSVCSSPHGFPGPAPIPAVNNSPFPVPIDPTKALQIVDQVNPAFDNVDDILECLLPLLQGASAASFTITSNATKSLPIPLGENHLTRQEGRPKRKYPIPSFEDDIPQAKRIHSNHAFFDEDTSTTSNLSPDSESSSSSQVVDQETIWDTRFKELCEFRQQHGNCLVRFNWNNNLALAKWVKRQRYQCKLKIEGKHSTLSEKRQQTLDDLGFVWDLQGALWEERLGELVEFRRLHGHCNVPSRYKDNHSLSVWVQVQRRQYKLSQEKDKRSYMTKERIARLEETGFIWKPRDYGKA